MQREESAGKRQGPKEVKMERLPKIREQQVEVAFVGDVQSRGALKKSRSVVSFSDAGRGDGAVNNFSKHMESRKSGTGIL